MEGWEIEVETGDAAVRVVRALGAHRYVLGRCHEIHVLAVDAARPALVASGAHAEMLAWADALLADAAVDKTSRDERLLRRASDAELVAVVSAFWMQGPHRADVRARLVQGLAPFERPTAPPFAETAEDGMFPVLIDAGWELLPLSLLDEERHRGVIESFEGRTLFENARFCEEDAIPAVVYLMELPAIGEAELLSGVDESGALLEPLVVWADGPEPYIDYLVRGVSRAASKPAA